jgi:hypothetical protein
MTYGRMIGLGIVLTITAVAGSAGAAVGNATAGRAIIARSIKDGYQRGALASMRQKMQQNPAYRREVGRALKSFVKGWRRDVLYSKLASTPKGRAQLAAKDDTIGEYLFEGQGFWKSTAKDVRYSLTKPNLARAWMEGQFNHGNRIAENLELGAIGRDALMAIAYEVAYSDHLVLRPDYKTAQGDVLRAFEMGEF